MTAKLGSRHEIPDWLALRPIEEKEDVVTKSRLSASLSLAMRRRKMTQTDLAERSDVPQPTISRILSGESDGLVRLGTVRKLKAALRCSWDDLLGK